MTEPRRWTADHPDGGRLDTRDIEWFACDPYPNWYRWSASPFGPERTLITHDPDRVWADGGDNRGVMPGEPCPRRGKGVRCSLGKDHDGGCVPVPSKPRRSRASAKAAGSRFERSVADYLRDTVDDRIDRKVKTGAKDTGDIGGVRFGGSKVVLECKDTAKMSLQSWLREAEVERQNDDAFVGVVVHKRIGTSAPGEQYVTMTLETFAALITRADEAGQR